MPVIISRSREGLTFPCEVTGQLTNSDEQDWYSIDCHKGEVLWLEGMAERIGSPVDLDLVIVDADQRELLHLSDEVQNLGGARFPTNHTDPAGRVPGAGGRQVFHPRAI